MKIDFDITKSLRNAVKRGLPFDIVEGFDWNSALVIEDLRNDYPERRYQALGLIDTQLHMVVFTPIKDGVRVISLRAASSKGAPPMVARKPRPTLIDKENPEWTAEDFARAKPLAEVLPELAEAAKRPGRPRAENPKVPVSLRLDHEVLEAFKRTGPGWQVKINEVLRKGMPKPQAPERKRA